MAVVVAQLDSTAQALIERSWVEILLDADAVSLLFLSPLLSRSIKKVQH